MNFFKRNKLATAIIIIIFAVFLGMLLFESAYAPSENISGADLTQTEQKETAAPNKKTEDAEFKEVESVEIPNEQADLEYSEQSGMEIDEESGTDKYKTEPVPEGKPVPVEEQDVQLTDTELTCTLSVRCGTALDKLDKLSAEKAGLLPDDGVIFPEQTVVFYEGESVFNLLLREMKKNKIHMEFIRTPIYNSAYIEGIANLYEYDCGELSGWMYSVNGWFPNYGCSRYSLKEGDKVEWLYTCDLGKDISGQTLQRQMDE